MLVTHGHFTVNSRRTDVPSMLLKEGDQIGIRDGSSNLTYFKELSAFAEKRTSPAWLHPRYRARCRVPFLACRNAPEIDGTSRTNN